MWDFISKAFDWLKDETNREILTLIGGSFAITVGAFWAVYTYFHPKPEAKKPEPQKPEEADRKHQELLAAIAREKGIEPKFLTPLFEAAGHDANIKPDQFETAIRAAVEALIVQSKNPVEPSNDGADIDAAIRAARQKLALFDTEGALTILRAREAEEAALVQSRNRGRANLKREEAEIYKNTFRHQEAITALTEATTLDPADFWALIELGDVHWHVLRQREPALAAYNQAEALAKAQGLQRKESVALDRKGDVLAVFDPATALKAYQDGFVLAKTLAAGDAANRGYQRDLSVSYEKIGDMLRASDPPAALKAYQDGLAIRKTLAAGDAANRQYQRDLTGSYQRIGDMLATSDPATALKAYQDGLAISKTLAEGDTANRQYQHDLSASYDRIGDMLATSDPPAALQAYQDSLAIAKTLAEGDAANRNYQRDLSVSFNKIGDMLAASDPAAALKAYQDSLAIRKTLAEGDMANRQYQRDLTGSYQRIGDMLAATDPSAALKAYQTGLAIAQTLAEGDPANREYQRDLAVNYAQLAGFGHKPRENWGKAFEIVSALHAKGLLDPVDEWMLEDARKNRDAARD